MDIFGNLGLLALAAGCAGIGWGFGAAWAIRKIVRRGRFEWHGRNYFVTRDPAQHRMDKSATDAINTVVKSAMARGDYDAAIARIYERNTRRKAV